MTDATIFRYIESKDRRKWDRLADQQSLHRMCSLVNPLVTDVVCDLGTGWGNAARAISPEVKRVIAMDVVSKRKEVFKETQCANVEFHCTDLHDGVIPADNATFDIVICRAALHHVENKARLFEECFRVLRCGGRLYIMDPVMSPELRLAWSIISRIAEKDYRAYCTEDELMSGIVGCGFEILFSGKFVFPRSLHDWIESKICELDSSGSEVESAFVHHVRQTIWNIVGNFLPDRMKAELYLNKCGEDVWFAYNCMELVAGKNARITE